LIGKHALLLAEPPTLTLKAPFTLRHFLFHLSGDGRPALEIHFLANTKNPLLSIHFLILFLWLLAYHCLLAFIDAESQSKSLRLHLLRLTNKANFCWHDLEQQFLSLTSDFGFSKEIWQ
jgi:hypothetical protein